MIRDNKTLGSGHYAQYVYALQHRNWLLCPAVAWGLWVLRKYVVDKQPFPDLRDPDWGKGPEYPSPTDQTASISYQANHQQLSAAWGDHEITDPDKWHAFRHYIYKELLLAGLSPAVIEAFMRHIQGKAKCSYDTALLFPAMLVCTQSLT